MSYLFLISGFLLALLLVFSKSIFYRNYGKINLKIKNSLDKMLKIIYFAPILVLCIILILTFTYFKSKGYIRLSHAWIVVNFWIYSVIFYYITIEIAKIRNFVILLPAIGMVSSALIAIYLTPLLHYENTFNNHNLIIPNLLGVFMLIVSYYTNYTLLKKDI
ncbi:hypothetical protein [Clostridium sp. 'White wine YQ']|uniref:hypothetical protein n=1 Tax=Clostridium sp. 'White wine YQ' TaxID=3027474 RepID=UPI0023660FF0|nr:hypothetical protein [Clostridium sp. 'White wine YQ']MDD7792954.1 hypothetical protein [Clostridium sp. 'White wine YQ']